MDIRNKGKIISRKGDNGYCKFYLDQLRSDKDKWVSSGWFTPYIKSRYGLSSKEYYDLVMGIESNPKCKYCGNLVPFVSLNIGYKTYCCHKCCLNYRNKYHNPTTIYGSPMKNKHHTNEARKKNSK